jgi:L-alanine-DL-glutamate epimerase-like enolase superfamily enzyme
MRPEAPIERLYTSVYEVPTDAPEADGTISWNHTTLVVAELSGGGCTGLGYTYASAAAADILKDVLAPLLHKQDAFAIPKLWNAMVSAVRNIGWRGVCANAIAAADIALWDLKARMLQTPLAQLFGKMRDGVPIYGSGGFTSYSDAQLREQLGHWAHHDGCQWVKMKIGTDPAHDPHRMRVAREAIGDSAALMIDANGALDRKQADRMAGQAAEFDVVWFEEPVSSDDLEGLHALRGRAPTGMEIAAGEYGYDPFYFKRMLDAQAVDVIQADATRCCGYSGFMTAAALAQAEPLPLSAHTAPAVHLPICCAAPRLRHIEWFHDHVRIERMFFDGAPVPRNGIIEPDLSRAGHGLELKRTDVCRYQINGGATK